MPPKKEKRGPPMCEEAKAWLKASDKGSWYNQETLLADEDSRGKKPVIKLQALTQAD